MIGLFGRSLRKARFCMKRETAKWVQKAEPDWEVAHKLASEKSPPRDIVCFHCHPGGHDLLRASRKHIFPSLRHTAPGRLIRRLQWHRHVVLVIEQKRHVDEDLAHGRR